MENWGTVLMPGGMRDLLPGEAGGKRELENCLLRLFQGWGYQEVVTPTFEFSEALSPALGEMLQDQLYRFIDEQGRVMVLRPDMTTPIARLVSTRLQEEGLPLRFSYVANVFRREKQASGKREFYQAGVELLGAQGPEADAEVLGLAGEAFRLAGINDFLITLGQVEVLNDLLNRFGLNKEQQQEAKKILSKKDFVSWAAFVAACSLTVEEKRALSELPYLHGGPEVLDKVESYLQEGESLAGISRLRLVWEILSAYELQEHFCFDMCFLRGLGYYTGIVFEGYAPGIGYPLCGGGRYDKLLEKLHFPCPATGFALNIEYLLPAWKKKRVQQQKTVDYFLAGENSLELVKKARSLREQGFVVEVEVTGRSSEEAVAFAAKKGIPHIIVI